LRAALWGLALSALWACLLLSTLSDFLLEVDKMITLESLKNMNGDELMELINCATVALNQYNDAEQKARWANVYQGIKEYLMDYGHIDVCDGDTGEVLATIDLSARSD
jgi:hypothetical protein